LVFFDWHAIIHVVVLACVVSLDCFALFEHGAAHCLLGLFSTRGSVDHFVAFKKQFVHSLVTVVDGHTPTQSVHVISTHGHFVRVDELVYLFVRQLKLSSCVWA